MGILGIFCPQFSGLFKYSMLSFANHSGDDTVSAPIQYCAIEAGSPRHLCVPLTSPSVDFSSLLAVDASYGLKLSLRHYE